ncbi:MAG: UDP-N-acetylmuramate dehydrogenase [Oliverpabstia sp.]|nr:UDP-N-acetylmuramate dehydrogenase [Eubacterium sp.]MDY2594482.1 UDP-N-acetylmuramate dehydrogenase [Oliverpabstia sp.]
MKNRFETILGQDRILMEEPMKKHTTFRLGGPADFFLCPSDVNQIPEIIHICREEGIPWFVLGNGSNLLVSDQGYRGVVIQIYKNMNQITVEGTRIYAQAGALLSAVSKKAMEAGLTGMEFASGIPGTLGGAAVMNAGAYGGEMKDILVSVTVLTDEGEQKVLKAEELNLGYRTSIIKERGYIVLDGVLQLQAGNRDAIKTRMEELKVQRVTKQPLEYPSAGSTFKRPEGYFAGKLIEDAGLRGYRVGGAQVSEKHCGFVINTGDATTSDVVQLIHNVQNIIWNKFKVKLEPEVKFLGDFTEMS